MVTGLPSPPFPRGSSSRKPDIREPHSDHRHFAATTRSFNTNGRKMLSSRNGGPKITCARLSENYIYWERLSCLIMWNSPSQSVHRKITKQLSQNQPDLPLKLNSSFTIRGNDLSRWEVFEISIGKLRRYLRYHSVVSIGKCCLNSSTAGSSLKHSFNCNITGNSHWGEKKSASWRSWVEDCWGFTNLLFLYKQ